MSTATAETSENVTVKVWDDYMVVKFDGMCLRSDYENVEVDFVIGDGEFEQNKRELKLQDKEGKNLVVFTRYQDHRCNMQTVTNDLFVSSMLTVDISESVFLNVWSELA